MRDFRAAWYPQHCMYLYSNLNPVYCRPRRAAYLCCNIMNIFSQVYLLDIVYEWAKYCAVCSNLDELVHGSLHNLADLAEYFQLKKYVQVSERVQMYLRAPSEALSIITGLSSFHFYTRTGYPNHSFNALQDSKSYFWQKESYQNSLRRRHECLVTLEQKLA